ncbi:MAG: LLM class flavin-dependent oxidoreductase [Acidobacteriota bacterium]|nr:LLM class flavin-dependent oxidoreductase [Acidobacteriota bacterium]
MIKLHWFLPTGGDSRDVMPEGPDAHWRAPSHDYLAQTATACDRLGYEAMLTPCGTMCEDAWLATASLIPLTERLKFLVAFRPGFLSPTLAAQMASTYQRMSKGRLLINIVTGAEPRELNRFGDWLDKDSRYERTGEFLDIMRHAWTGEPYDFEGKYYKVAQATTREVPDPAPPVYFGGASPAAEAVAASHVDVYLAWGEPPAMVAERLERMTDLAAAQGRELGYGIRFHVIARRTSEEAWRVANDMLAHMSEEAIAAAQADFGATMSEGQRRMASLHGGDAGNLEIHPNVWAGIGLVRGGVGTALVGSYEEVAERIQEYHELGFGEFILSGYPHLEEAYWFAEGVMPVLRRIGLLQARAEGAPIVYSFR